MNSRALEKLRYHVLAVGSLAGTIIGVGMFGLPYVALQAGFFITALYLITFGVIVSISHLLYAEVTLRTREHHRFTGYAGMYLGPKWKTITLIQGIISFWGTLLVYTIVAGGFLKIILEAIGYSIASEALLGVVFFLIGGIIIWRGDDSVGTQETLFMLPMALIIVAIFIFSLVSPHFSVGNLSSLHLSSWVLPYGITLFSLAGFSVIPLLEHVLAPARKKRITINYPAIIFSGTLIPAFLYILFVWGVLGVSGSQTSEDALTGLAGFLGPEVVVTGALLGLLSLYTSFIAIGNELAKTFMEDYRVSKVMSFCIALVIPLFLYVANVKDFITVAGFVGALMGGYVGILSILMVWRAKEFGNDAPPFSFRLSPFLGISIIIIFAFASLYALFDMLSPLFLSAIPT